mmetsp:Transcript_15659/g.29686  ORF Transcript_15659/g.29686 Transcript_15659/m.29686 type:complete len:191 (-) Transcript_15659:136-708(-)|eukprot:CAMPEP_0201657678 /NCGR_PEP_ID=MMETSP0494-20130426/834_1 /ASSEMBLY_ACC=CAM_ASM_000839 /TAXON_ID=420259 /ORGANISM="Thalassiosira gravida, Strain GMp14c1" /LENGTH=190 /DNA_ID=CAMNT_0048134557 /DNA_START=45 /DNA_END=617 /DNA_ORIENTATION=-
MPCLRYICCPCLLCCRGSKKDDSFEASALAPAANTAQLAPPSPLTPEQEAEYDDLVHLATKREIRCTIRKSTQAGMAAGLSVMAGTLIAGPVGAVAGGAIGTALAVNISANIFPLNKLLDQTPPEKRGEVIKLFNEAFKEEFMETIESSPELKLLLSGRSPLGVVRYMVDRDLIKNEKLEKLDGILSKVM